jgi:CheY-like chemotaxis protein
MNAELIPAASSVKVGFRSRVMVIEDDPIVRRLIRIRLTRAGLSVIAAGSGEEAVAIVESGEQPVHLVVTDGVMPGMDGFAVARFFARQSPPVRVILLSGFLSHFVSQADIPGNIEAYFGKPFSADELVAKVFELIRLPV